MSEIPLEYPTRIEAFWKAERLKEATLCQNWNAGSTKKLWCFCRKLEK